MLHRRAVQVACLSCPGVPNSVPALVDPGVEQVREEVQNHIHHCNGDEVTIPSFVYVILLNCAHISSVAQYSQRGYSAQFQR